MNDFEYNYSYVKRHDDLGESTYQEMGVISALLNI
jgi:hypothetical protein